MRTATHDRGEVLRLAGSSHLSPGVRDGVPVLLPEDETAGRTGWQRYFEALDRSGLELAWDTEDPASASPVPVAEGRPLERHSSLAQGIDSARRLLAAWRREAPAAPPEAT